MGRWLWRWLLYCSYNNNYKILSVYFFHAFHFRFHSNMYCTHLTLSPVSSAPLAMTGWLQTIGLHVGRTSAVSSEYHVPYLREIRDSKDNFLLSEYFFGFVLTSHIQVIQPNDNNAVLITNHYIISSSLPPC